MDLKNLKCGFEALDVYSVSTSNIHCHNFRKLNGEKNRQANLKYNVFYESASGELVPTLIETFSPEELNNHITTKLASLFLLTSKSMQCKVIFLWEIKVRKSAGMHENAVYLFMQMYYVRIRVIGNVAKI